MQLSESHIQHCNVATLNQQTEFSHEGLHTGNANKDIWSDYGEWVCVLQPAGNST
jgi:hypothetical protein